MASEASTEIKETLKAFQDHWEISASFVQPYFQLATRLYKLWRGVDPDELNGFYTKCNLQIGHSAVQERIPKRISTVFSSEDHVSLNAHTPLAEIGKDGTQLWLRNLLQHDINIKHSIMPCMQSVEIIGTGYRRPTVTYRNGQPRVVGKNVDFFHVLPAPVGGLVNPLDGEQEAAVPWIHYVDFMLDEHITAMADRNGGFNKNEVKRMIDSTPDTASGVEQYYKAMFSNTVGGVVYDGPQSWRSRIDGAQNAKKRRRVVFYERPDGVTIVADDQFVLYEGPDPILPGKIRLAKYVATPDLQHWYGISALELLEDIIIAILLNVNMRQQALIQAMFPIKWIRQDIVQGKTEADFEEIGAMLTFPENIDNIKNIIHYDRGQEAPQQAFMEDAALKYFMQAVTGVADISKAINSGGMEKGTSTATGMMNIVEQAAARFNMENEQLEYGGLREECRLYLALGNKYVTERTDVHDPNSKDGFEWIQIDPNDINDAYEVITHGTAYLADRQNTVQKFLAYAPMLLNAEQGVNKTEVLRQGNEIMDVFSDPEKITISEQEQQQLLAEAAGQGSTPGIGGMAAPQSMQNRNESVAGRSDGLTPAGTTV